MEGRTIQVEIMDIPPCQADPAMMRQVLANLLENAVKYTRPREQARITLGCNVEPDQPVYYIVDNGVGFDMQYADQLFGVFQRIHRADEFEGTGVGLAVVHKIIQRHGGRVWAESVPDQGTTFYFTTGENE
jgi:light-regulated signal transduction histidine kinase (bacteriophytochrome)